MNRFFMIVVIVLLSSSAFGQSGPRQLAGPTEIEQTQTQPQPQAQTQRVQTQAQQIQQRVADLYLASFKNEVELSDEQFVRLGIDIRRYIQARFRVANQRRMLNQRQDELLAQENPPQEELQKLNQEQAKLDNEAGTLDSRFMGRIGGELSTLQVTQVRAFNQKFFNQRLQAAIEQARAAAAAPRNQRPNLGARPNRSKDPTGGAANTLRGKNNPVPPAGSR